MRKKKGIKVGEITYLPSKVLAARVHLVPDYVTRLARSGLVRGVRQNGVWYLDPDHLREYLAEHDEHKRAINERTSAARRAELFQAQQALMESRATQVPVLRLAHPALRASLRRRTQLLAASRYAAAAIASVVLLATSTHALMTSLPVANVAASGTVALANPFERIADGVFRSLCPLFSSCEHASVVTVVMTAPVPASTSTAQQEPTRPVQQIINQPVIERIVERAQFAPATISPVTLQDLAALESRIDTRIASISLPIAFPQSIGAAGVPIPNNAPAPASQRIDQLNGVTITNAHIVGGDLSGTTGVLTSLPGTASFDSATITNATTTNLVVTGTLTAPALSFTGLALTNSTTTNATTTNLYAQSLSLGSPLAVRYGGTGTSTAPTYGKVLVGNSAGGYDLLATSSLGITGGGGGTWGSITGTLSNQTDLQNALNAKFDLSAWYATTTTALAEGSNLYFTSARATSNFVSSLAATTSVASITTLPNLSLPSSQVTGLFGYLFPNNATTTGLGIYASTTIGNGTATGGLTVSGTAATTNLKITSITSALHLADATGNVTAYSGTSCTNQFIRSLNGAGVATCASVNLASDVTGTLPVANGGTGWAAIQSGALVYGNGAGALATTTAGTNGQVLALLGGVPTWTATTTFGTGLSYSAGNVTNTGVLALGPLNQTTNGTATFATSTAGTDFTITGSGSTITFNIPTASAANRGLLSSADWSAFAGRISSSSLSATFPLAYNSGSGAFTFNGLSTSSAAVTGNIPYFSGPNTFANVATTSFAAANSTLTVTGTLGALIGGANSTIALNLGNANTWTALQTFANATTTLLSATYASSTNLFAGTANISSLTLGTLSGILKATAGSVSTSLVNLASDITGVLGIANGGTGTSTAPTYGKLLVGNAAGGYDLLATSSLGITSGITGTQGYAITFDGTGAQTATSSLFFASNKNIGIGTTTPWARLSLDTSNLATGVPEFSIGSSTRQDLVVTQSGNVGIATTSPGSLFAIGGIANFQSGTSTLYQNLNVQGTLKVGTGSIYLNSTATSSFANGIDIASGCFSISGTCLISGGTGITAGDLNSAVNNFVNAMQIASSTGKYIYLGDGVADSFGSYSASNLTGVDQVNSANLGTTYSGVLSGQAASGGGNTVLLLTTTGANTWTVPSDWNSGNNTIAAIGGGGSGATAVNNGSRTGTGGGGGAYAAISNQSFLPGTAVSYSVGTGGTAITISGGATGGNPGSDTWFGAASFGSALVGAKGGSGGNAATADVATSGGAGGAAGSSIGTVKFSGGAGGDRTGTSHIGISTGGGGAAGPNGAGVTPAAQSNQGGWPGGAGDNGSGGAGGNGTTGGAGAEWTSNPGGVSAGSGGGGSGTLDGNGFSGGQYGAGGGGSVNTGGTMTSGAGKQGIIVITYNPLNLYADLFLVSNAFTASTSPATAKLLFAAAATSTFTPNVDVEAAVSRDNGSHWATTTLAVLATLEDGSKLLGDTGVNLASQPAGTSMKYRIYTHNSKAISIYGVALEWGTVSAQSAGTLSVTGALSAGSLTLSSPLGITSGGTGASSFTQGWIYADGLGNPLAASTSPTVAYIVATSTTASRFVNASTTNISAGYASSTLAFFGNLSIGTLSGILKATAGSVATSLVNLTSDITGVLDIANGGTGTTTAPIGQLLYGGSTAYQSVATTTLSLGLGLSNTGTLGALVGGTAATLNIATSSLFTGSTGQVPYFTGTNALAGTSTMFLSSAGFFGLGTTSPSYPLSISGSVLSSWGGITEQLHSSSSETGLQFYNSGAGGQTYALFSTSNASGLGGGKFVIGDVTNTAARMTITGSGNIGIGTTSPNGKLSVQQSADTFGNALRIVKTGGEFNGYWDMWQDSTNYLNFGWFGGNTKMVIGSNGNVGIGTTTPWAQLSVNPNGITGPAFAIGSSTATSFVVTNGGIVGVGTSSPSQGASCATADCKLVVTGSADEKLVLETSSSTMGAAIMLRNSGFSNSPRFEWQLVASSTDAASRLRLNYLGTGVVADAMSILGNGNVGIGTSSPAQALSVTGRVYTTSGIQFPDGTFQSSAAAGASSGTQGQFAFYNANGTTVSGTSTLFVTQSSNIGIGTTSPVSKLAVNGNITVPQGGFLYLNGQGSGWGPSITTGYTGTRLIANTGSDGFQINNQVNTVGLVRISNAGGFSLGTTYYSTDPGASNMIVEGSVGIGTTTPSRILDVYSSAGYAGIFRGNSGGAAAVGIGGINSAGALQAFTDDSGNAVANLLLNPSGGSVGIGTTTPLSSLVVAANTTGTSTTNVYSGTLLDLYSTANNASSTAGIRMRTGSGWNVQLRTVQNDNWLELADGGGLIKHSWYNNKYYPGATSNAGTNTGFITGDGTNIGIGTSTPSNSAAAPFAVYSSGEFSTFLSGGIISGNYRYTGIAIGQNPGAGTAANIGYMTNQSNTALSGTYMTNYGDAEGTSGIFVQKGGNVGIGTTSPWATLAVNPTAGLAANQFVVGSSTATNFLINNSGNIFFNTTNANPVSGNVDGVTIAPKGFLNVNHASGSGGAAAFGSAQQGSMLSFYYTASGVTGVGSVSITNTNTAYNTTSDRRLKENIATTTSGLALLSQIPVRDFDFINDPDHKKTQGFIAQELYGLYPYAVTTNGDNGDVKLATSSTPWQVDYGRLTPLIVKAVQDVAAITGVFRDNLIAWLGDASNGIDKLFAKEIHAQNVFADEVDAGKLCAKKSTGGYVCVTGDQLDALLAGAAAAQSAPAASAASSSPASSASLTINGNDPASWQKGTAWSDNLGALFSHNGIHETVYSTSTVDTSLAGTTTIDYWATWYSDPAASSSAQTLHTTRQVVVIDPFATAATTTSTSTVAASTTPTDTATSTATSTTP